MRRLRAMVKIQVGRAGACRIEQRGLPPDRQHGFLRQFLGAFLRWLPSAA